MIHKKIIAQRLKEFQIQEFISNNMKRVGHSHTKLQMTPLGEKITIFASRPGLIVGKKGQSIKRLTSTLKKKFDLENPQIEISEVENPNLDAHIVAERVANSLEKFGIARFKGVGHKTMEDVMNAGALGIEIIISGKVPSSRAKSWRFYQGYLKKSGSVSMIGVKKAYAIALLKTGVIGVQVRIMPPDVYLPDDIQIKKEDAQAQTTGQKEVKDEKKAEELPKEEKNEKKQSKEKKPRTTRKKVKDEYRGTQELK